MLQSVFHHTLTALCASVRVAACENVWFERAVHSSHSIRAVHSSHSMHMYMKTLRHTALSTSPQLSQSASAVRGVSGTGTHGPCCCGYAIDNLRCFAFAPSRECAGVCAFPSGTPGQGYGLGHGLGACGLRVPADQPGQTLAGRAGGGSL